MENVNKEEPRAIALEELEEILRRTDRRIDRAHEDADEALCTLLTKLGYADVVDLWKKVPKWYA